MSPTHTNAAVSTSNSAASASRPSGGVRNAVKAAIRYGSAAAGSWFNASMQPCIRPAIDASNSSRSTRPGRSFAASAHWPPSISRLRSNQYEPNAASSVRPAGRGSVSRVDRSVARTADSLSSSQS